MEVACGRKRHHSALEHVNYSFLGNGECVQPAETQPNVQVSFIQRYSGPDKRRNGTRTSNSSSSSESNDVFNEAAARAIRVHGDRRAVDKGGKSFFCEKCQRSFDYACRFEAHMRTHSYPRQYACDYEGCHCAFASASRLRRHAQTHYRRVHYSNSEPDVDGCELESANGGVRRLGDGASSLHADQSTMFSDSRRVGVPRIADLTCPTCKRVFSRTDNLKVHIRRVHNRASSAQATPESRQSTPMEQLGPSQRTVNYTDDELLCPLPSCGAPFNTRCGLVGHMKMHLRDFGRMLSERTPSVLATEREDRVERSDAAVNTEDSQMARRSVANQTDFEFDVVTDNTQTDSVIDPPVTPTPTPTPAAPPATQSASGLCTPPIVLDSPDFEPILPAPSCASETIATACSTSTPSAIEFETSFVPPPSLAGCPQKPVPGPSVPAQTRCFPTELGVTQQGGEQGAYAYRCPCDNCPFGSSSRVEMKRHLSKHLNGELAGDPLLMPFLGLTESDINDFDVMFSDMMMDVSSSAASGNVLDADAGAGTQDDSASLLRALDLMHTPARHNEPGTSGTGLDFDDIETLYQLASTGAHPTVSTSYYPTAVSSYYEPADTVHVSAAPISLTPNVSALTLPSVNKQFAKNMAAKKQSLFSGSAFGGAMRSPLVDRRVQQAVLAPPIIGDGCARTDALCNGTMCELVRRRREQLRAVTSLQNNLSGDRPVRIQQVLVAPVSTTGSSSASVSGSFSASFSRAPLRPVERSSVLQRVSTMPIVQSPRSPRRMSISNGSLQPAGPSPIVPVVGCSNEPLMPPQTGVGSLMTSPCAKASRSVSTSAARWRTALGSDEYVSSAGAVDANVKMSAVVNAITDATIRSRSAASRVATRLDTVHQDFQLSSLNLSYVSPRAGTPQQKGVNIITLTPTNAKRARSNLGAPY